MRRTRRQHLPWYRCWSPAAAVAARTEGTVGTGAACPAHINAATAAAGALKRPVAVAAVDAGALVGRDRSGMAVPAAFAKYRAGDLEALGTSAAAAAAPTMGRMEEEAAVRDTSLPIPLPSSMVSRSQLALRPATCCERVTSPSWRTRNTCSTAGGPKTMATRSATIT